MDKKSKHFGVISSLLWGTGMACIIALLPYSSLSRGGVIALCATGAVAFILAVAHHGWLWSAPFPIGKPVRAALWLFLIIGAMGALGWIVFPPIRRHALSPKERDAFRSYLQDKGNDGKYEIHIACPLIAEKECAYANQFVSLFGEANWKVQPWVDRISVSKPVDGVWITLSGGNKDYMMKHWDAGAYYPINELHVLAVHSAFQSIAIETAASSDPDLPQNAMRIYFGPERENEAEPTDLSRDIDWATGKTPGPFPTPRNQN